MHHKYVVRDRADVWTGSTNWTDDAFSREENAIVRVSSPEVAASYARNFEQLWIKGRLESSGGEGASITLGRGVDVQPLFSPKGPSLAHRTAERIAAAHHRVRILSPVITSGVVPSVKYFSSRFGHTGLSSRLTVENSNPPTWTLTPFS